MPYVVLAVQATGVVSLAANGSWRYLHGPLVAALRASGVLVVLTAPLGAWTVDVSALVTSVALSVLMLARTHRRRAARWPPARRREARSHGLVRCRS